MPNQPSTAGQPRYRVEVKRRDAAPRPWIWEIYFGNEKLRISDESYPLRMGAYIAGIAALRPLLHTH